MCEREKVKIETEEITEIKNFAPNIPRIFGRFKGHKNPPALKQKANKKEAPTYE